MSDEQDDPIQPSPEYQAFKDDLQAYHNPEVFEDATLPQFYRLFIRTTHLPEVPYMLNIEVNGEALPLALRESLIQLSLSFQPNEDADLAAIRAELATDEEYLEAEQAMRRFFIRHFPKLMVHVYEIAITMSLVSVIGKLMEQGEDREKLFKGALKSLLRLLGTDIKQWLGTRKRGGSAAKLTDEIRTSLYEYYDDIHLMAKSIKKDYNDTFKRFEESRRNKGYKFEEWQQFWINHAMGLYLDYDKDFLASFAQEDHPSASEITYRWLSHRTGGKRSYVERLVKQTRKDSGKTRPRKGQ